MNYRMIFLFCVLILVAGCMSLGGVKTDAPKRETCRSYLTGEQEEEEGYGLYSYILFGSPPTDSSRERYEKAIIAYLTVPPLPAMKAFFPLQHLNVTYLPLADTPPPEIEAYLKKQCPRVDQNSKEWLVDHYHYARARAILRLVPASCRKGPYILSYAKPLTGSETLSGQYLFQDLSLVPPNLVDAWVREFIEQASQPDYTQERAAQQLVLKMRTAIEVAAEGLPQIQSALDTWIAWIE